MNCHKDDQGHMHWSRRGPSISQQRGTRGKGIDNMGGGFKVHGVKMGQLN